MLEGKMRLSSIVAAVLISGCTQDRLNVRRINPPTLYPTTNYAHVVSASGGRTIYVSGLVPLDKDGKLVGPDDFTAQARQVFENVKAALAATDATMADVVKINLYVLDASQIVKFREVRSEYFKDPPASTAAEVRALIRPGVMLEMDAIAVAK
jgi:enamine deaminase RidA (YjgF/YER057c/UK114 family)